MQKKLLFVTLASLLCLGACVSTEVDGHMAVYNRSASSIQVVVDGVDTGPVMKPNGSGNFSFHVNIPTGSQGSIDDPNNQIVSVEVAVRNLSTGKLSDTHSCSAGAKVVTSLTYSIEGTPQFPFENVNCTYTY